MVLPEQRCQKCAKLGRHFGAAGTALPKMRQVGRKLPNLQQVWFKYAKLTVSMAIRAILGAFPAAQAILGVFLAALGSMIMLVRSSRFIVGSLKLRINGCLQIRRQAFCFSCAFHMRQRFGTKLDVYGCFDSPLNGQIKEKPPLNTSFDL